MSTGPSRFFLFIGVSVLALSCRSGGAASPLALYPASPEGANARLQGTLEMAGDCLYITRTNGERWLAAFPSPGTTWEAGERSVRLGDKALRVGGTSGFTGGEMSRGAEGIGWVRAPAKECDSSKIWLVTALAGPD